LYAYQKDLFVSSGHSRVADQNWAGCQVVLYCLSTGVEHPASFTAFHGLKASREDTLICLTEAATLAELLFF